MFQCAPPKISLEIAVVTSLLRVDPGVAACLQASMDRSIDRIPNGFRWAAFQCLLAFRDFRRSHRLVEDIALPDVIIPPEESGDTLAANVAVDAGGIDIKAASDVLRKSVGEVSHKGIGVMGAATSSPHIQNA